MFVHLMDRFTKVKNDPRIAQSKLKVFGSSITGLGSI
jgi:hypothetical protein